MRAVVEVLARALTDRPDEVRVTETQHQRTTLIELFVAPGELGKVHRQAGPDGGGAAHAGGDGRREGTARRSRWRFGTSRVTGLNPIDVNWDEMALVGRIARAHGIRGQVIVNLETDFPDERFQPGAELFIERGGAVEALTVTTRRGFSSERPVIGIAGVETMNDAEALAGLELRVPVERLAPLPAGHVLPARPDRLPGRDARRARRSASSRTSKGRSSGSRLVVRRRRRRGADSAGRGDLHDDRCRRRSGS